MYFKVYSGNMLGMSSQLIGVESDVSEGMPSMELVGFLSSEVKEARERVKTALKNNNISLPARKITINLSPADIKKYGTGFDLPIALSILGCMGVIENVSMDKVFAIGELSLNGELRSVSGVLPKVLLAKDKGFETVLLPNGNAAEAAVVDGISIIGINSISEAIDYLNGELYIAPKSCDIYKLLEESYKNDEADFKYIKGQENLKRGLEIAAAGMHNILITGAPGTGKTMCARALPSILPPLSKEESLQISKIYSVAGLLKDKSIITLRPFVDPHHTISATAMSGGGINPKPGSISLAHNGVLFLDELPEFKTDALEVLRQPMENKDVVLSRGNSTYIYPADFMLVAAKNPCRCGYYPDRNRCNCSLSDVKKYEGKISGPLLDRIDINVSASATKYADLIEMNTNIEDSACIRKRVMEARDIQIRRFCDDGILSNSAMNSNMIEKYCKVDASGKKLLSELFEKLNMSARGYHKMLKVARTIADLDGGCDITKKHIYEALGFRNASI